jgi:hypothetical protein
VKNLVTTAGTVDPGRVGGVGTLTLAGTAASTLAGATFQVDLSSAGTSDLLQNNASTLTLTGASLQVSATSTPTSGRTFTIINSPGGISGTFTALADGAVFTASNGRVYVIHYTATAVTLTVLAAPGPSLIAAGTDVGGPPEVHAYNADGSSRFTFSAYAPPSSAACA